MAMIIGCRYRALLLDRGRVASFEADATEQRVVLIGVQARQLWADVAGKRGVAVDDAIRPNPRTDGRG